MIERCPFGTMERPSCKKRACPFCGPRWARDWQRVLSQNLDSLGGPVATIAITGPGAQRLPWDEAWCAHRRPHRHSGTRGCRVMQAPLSRWCETLSYRWQLLRQAARVATQRELRERWKRAHPGERLPPLSAFAPAWLVARVWEPQKRGVPHLHLVVPYGTWREREVADVFRGHLARLVGEYDFGHVQGKLAPIEGREAARYVANYLAGRSGKKSSIRDNIADPRLPRSLLWLTPRLTRETLVTMRTLRRARHLWAAMDGRCELPRFTGWEEGVRVAAVFRRIYPRRAGPLPDELDVDSLLEWGRMTDQWEQDQKLRPLFYEDDKIRDRALRIGRWAFRVTAPPAAVAVAA